MDNLAAVAQTASLEALLRDRTGLSGLSKEARHWITVPSSNSFAERQKLSKELEVIESQLFSKQVEAQEVLDRSKLLKQELDRCKTEAERRSIQQSLDDLPRREVLLNEINMLDAKRTETLNEYWNKYMKSEWPQAAENAASLRRKMTSPSSLYAAEHMLAMKSGAGVVGSTGFSPLVDEPASPKGKRLKRSYTGSDHGLTENSTSGLSSDAPGSPRTQNPQQHEVRCNCKKSRCLKLYCDCFAARKMCVDECKCLDCANNSEHNTERNNAIKSVLERRPDAFQNKVYVATVVNGSTYIASSGPAAVSIGTMPTSNGEVALAHIRGCSCRRTKCTKKYCVCYNTNAKCGDWCRCTGCENGKPDSTQQLSQGSESASQEAMTDRLSVLAEAANPLIASQ